MTEQNKELITARAREFATTYTNRHFLNEPAFAFGNEGWAKFVDALVALSHPKSIEADSGVIAAPVDHVPDAGKMVAGAHPDKGTSALPFPARIMDQLQDMARRKSAGSCGLWTDGDGQPLQDDADTAIAWIKAAAQVVPAHGVQGGECEIPPLGWRCTRQAGHDGPCAAIECPGEVELVQRGVDRLKTAQQSAHPVAPLSAQDGWHVTGCSRIFWNQEDADYEARQCGGNTLAYRVYKSAQPVEVQRVPLTGLQLRDIARQYKANTQHRLRDHWNEIVDLVRDVEAAHGIKPTGTEGCA